MRWPGGQPGGTGHGPSQRRHTVCAAEAAWRQACTRGPGRGTGPGSRIASPLAPAGCDVSFRVSATRLRRGLERTRTPSGL